jgi:hypothetical protein
MMVFGKMMIFEKVDCSSDFRGGLDRSVISLARVHRSV